MSDIRVEIRADRFLQGLNKLAPNMTSGLRTFIAAFTVRLMGQVKANIAQLFRSTGPLYESVNYRVTDTPDTSTGEVFTQGIPYARIQEEGGTTRPHTIVPRIASVLAFEGPTGLMFAKQVNHPGSHIVGRGYASSALASMRGEYSDGIREVVARATGELR